MRLIVVSAVTVWLAILCSCSTVKIPQGYNRDEGKIAIVSIELSGTLVMPLIPSPLILFGLPGALVEQLITPAREDPETLEHKIRQAWGDWRPESVLRHTLAEELAKRKKNVIQENDIIPLPQDIRTQLSPKSENLAAARLWYDPDVTVFDHSAIMKRYSPMAIMEVGYGNFYIAESWASFAMLIKVVDYHTNKVVARKRAVARLTTAKYDFKNPNHVQQFVADFKAGFENAVARTVPTMLDDIGL